MKIPVFDPSNVDRIPKELRDRPQWVNWRFELDERKSKSKGHSAFTKRPVFWTRRGWRWASSRKPRHWTAFEGAIAEWRNAGNPDVNDGTYATASQYVDGIGFVFTRDDDFVGIDLDECIDDECNLHLWARRWVQHFNTYTEISPRGRGLKMWIIVPGSQGSLLPTLELMDLVTKKDRNKESLYQADPEGSGTGCSGMREDDGVPIKECEVYAAGRYFTVTGSRLESTPAEVAVVDEQRLGALLEDMLRERVKRVREAEVGSARRRSAARLESTRRASLGLALSDQGLLNKARSARNGAVFRSLYDEGDLTVCGEDHSRADLCLCGMLAFWCGGDDERIDQLFRRSALYRDKWERDDYRRNTIAVAIQRCDTFYPPEVGPTKRRSRSPKCRRPGKPRDSGGGWRVLT